MTTESGRQWFHHALRQAPWRAQVRVAAMVALVLVVSVMIGVLYLWQATSDATAGRDLEALTFERERLHREVENLRAQLASAQTLPVLTRRALDMGFAPVSNDQILYLVVQGFQPPEEGPVVSVEPPVIPEYNQTLNDWIVEQWGRLLALLDVPASGVDGAASGENGQP